MKRAPDNVRYPEQFGRHILTQSFTARDPQETFNGTLIDYKVGVSKMPNESSLRAPRILLAARANSVLDEGEGEETHNTPSWGASSSGVRVTIARMSAG